MRIIGLVVIGLLLLGGIIAGAILLCPRQPVPPSAESVEKPKEEVAPPCCPQVILPERLTIEVTGESSSTSTTEIKGPIQVEILSERKPEKPEEEATTTENVKTFALAVTVGNYISGIEARILPSPLGGAVTLQPVQDGFLISARILATFADANGANIYGFAGLGYASYSYGSGVANYTAGAGVSAETGVSLFFFVEGGWVWAICAQGPLLQCGLGLAF